MQAGCNAPVQANSAQVSPSNSRSHSPSPSPSPSVSSSNRIGPTIDCLPKKTSGSLNRMISMAVAGNNKVAPSRWKTAGATSLSGTLGLASGSLQDLKQKHQQQHQLHKQHSGPGDAHHQLPQQSAQCRPVSARSSGGGGSGRRHNLSIENLAAAAAARRNQIQSQPQSQTYHHPHSHSNRNSTMLLIAQNQHIPQAQLDDQHSGQLFANMLNRTTRQIQQQQQLQSQQTIASSNASLNSSGLPSQQLQVTTSQQHQQHATATTTHGGSIKVNQDSSSSALSKHQL